MQIITAKLLIPGSCRYNLLKKNAAVKTAARLTFLKPIDRDQIQLVLLAPRDIRR
jgi:hypothetical protein